MLKMLLDIVGSVPKPSV